jgi:hypothetical protein
MMIVVAGMTKFPMAEKRTRRDLLKSYYQEPALPEIEKKEEPKRIDPIDIDSIGYHAELAHNMMLKEQGLVEMIQKDNLMVKGIHFSIEIRDLDGKVKSLVYKNYNKFLISTDTIKKVEQYAGVMESRATELEQKLNSVTGQLSAISNEMAPKLKKMQELQNVHNLLKKLNVIIEMPQKLNELLDQKHYADAVAYYSRASLLLQKVSHIAMFRKIQDECQQIMSQVGTRVQKKVFSGQGTLLQLCEGFGLLVGLKSMPASDLGKQFLYRSTDFLDTLLKPKEPVTLIQSEVQQGDSPHYPHFEKFSKFHREYLDQMSLFVDCYDSFFLTQKPRTEDATGLEALKQNCFAVDMTDQERAVAKDDLTRCLKEKQDAYFAFLDAQLQAPKSAVVSPHQFVTALTNLRKEVGSAEPLTKLTDVDERLAKLSMLVLDRIIHGIFGKVNQDFVVKIDGFASETMFNITRLMTNWIKEALIANALPALEDFMNSNSTHSFGSTELLIRIKDALVQFWNDLANQMMKRQPNQPFLVFSRLSHEWSKGVIEAVFSMYQQRLFMPQSGIYIPQLSESVMTQLITQTCTYFASLSKKLASRFVQDKLLLYTYKVKEYAFNPLLIDQVTMVSSLWRQIHQDVEAIQQQVRSAFKADDVKKALAGKHTVVHSKRPSATPDLGRSKTASHRSQTLFDPKLDPLISTLDKLFDERITYLPQELELKPVPIVASLVKCILKCHIECVRLKSYTSKEYQQIQVDVGYIRLHLWEFADEKVVNVLCDEILVSAELQGKDIVPLDPLVSFID